MSIPGVFIIIHQKILLLSVWNAATNIIPASIVTMKKQDMLQKFGLQMNLILKQFFVVIVILKWPSTSIYKAIINALFAKQVLIPAAVITIIFILLLISEGRAKQKKCTLIWPRFTGGTYTWPLLRIWNVHTGTEAKKRAISWQPMNCIFSFLKSPTKQMVHV